MSKPPPVTGTIYICSRLGSFCGGAFLQPGCPPSKSISSVWATPYDVAVSSLETPFEPMYRRCRVGLLPSHLVVDQRLAPYATLSADSWL